MNCGFWKSSFVSTTLTFEITSPSYKWALHVIHPLHLLPPSHIDELAGACCRRKPGPRRPPGQAVPTSGLAAAARAGHAALEVPAARAGRTSGGALGAELTAAPMVGGRRYGVALEEVE